MCWHLAWAMFYFNVTSCDAILAGCRWCNNSSLLTHLVRFNDVLQLYFLFLLNYRIVGTCNCRVNFSLSFNCYVSYADSFQSVIIGWISFE